MSRRSPDAEFVRDAVHDEDKNQEIERIDRPADIARQDRAALVWRERAQQVKLVSSSPGAIIPPSWGGSRWPRTIRIRQDASVTTAEPAIAVARDQVIDRVADHPWDEVEDPCPPPARKLARNAQHGFGFYIALTVRDEGKGIRAIRIDPELVSERTSLGQLNRNETKVASTITFVDEMAAARA